MSRRIIASFVCCWMLVAASAFGQTNPINLFEKKNLADWDFHVVQEGTAEVKVADVFSFADDGRLLCTGKPFGYLVTKESYKNYKLAVEWRWPTGTPPTNSGIFIKVTDMPKDSFLPKSIEAQLQHRNAGDLWAFHGRTITEPAPRLRNAENAAIGRFMGVAKSHMAENEPGQWNSMEILCTGSLVVVTVNGKIVNWTTGAEPIEGRVGFQSEGDRIEFRNAVLTVLP
ncbi:MAG: DUF1080 domain-containing protein [Planctomycetaceae bacterium]|nr:DUF1080 domain-containing protein [Planctomycetaceae bacterium]